MSASTQNQYNGEGWNDCAPTNFVEPLSRPGSRSVSRASTRKRSLYVRDNRDDVSSRASSVSSLSSTGMPPLGTSISIPQSATSMSKLPPTSLPTPLICDSTCEQLVPPKTVHKNQVVEDSGSVENEEELGVLGGSEKSTCVSPVVVLTLFDRILRFPTTLCDREFDQYKTRMQNTIPELDSVHLEAIYKCFEQVLGSHKKEARETVIQHSLYHMGISSWILPLRKLIESVQV